MLMFYICTIIFIKYFKLFNSNTYWNMELMLWYLVLRKNLLKDYFVVFR